MRRLERVRQKQFSERREKRKKRKRKAETRRSDIATPCTYTLEEEVKALLS